VAENSALFRFDADAATGGGHAMRCLTLAETLETAGWTCQFAVGPGTLDTVVALAGRAGDCIELPGDVIGQPDAMAGAMVDGCDVLIVDHYGWSMAEETPCRDFAGRILVIDDLADRPHDCDILLDQSLGRRAADYTNLVPDRCKVLVGPAFALLKPAFVELREATLQRRAISRLERILITFGLTDPDNLTGRALDALADAGWDGATDVILGGGAPHLATVLETVEKIDMPVDVIVDADDMAGPMAAADMAIGACGTTSWERCCLGLPTMTLTAAENQRGIADALMDAGAVIGLGWHGNVDAARMALEIRGLMRGPERLQAVSAAAAEICDGGGAHRMMEEIGHD